ncbi:unnamed protein product, partial [Symbiodinium microadriaticum]
DWMAVDDIQHTYAAKDFEQQVIARLATQADHGIERLISYTISGDNVTKQADLQQRFPSSWASPKPFRWKYFKPMKGSSPDPMEVECDLYLRGTDLKPNDLFKDCAQRIVQLAGTTPWEQIRTTADLPIILAEVAETPASLQAKLWQLERALTFGPDLQQAACCVVCLNADKNSFQAASAAARRSLNSSKATFKLAHFDVFAIWTQYRNVYAEIRNVYAEIRNVKDDVRNVKDDVRNVKDDVREVKTLLAQLIQKLEQ